MATLRDIEKMTGVSLATISRILNDHPGVSKKKKEIVLQAMKEVGYVPPERSRSRKKKRKSIIVISTLANFFSAMHEGMVDEARELGYTMLASFQPWDMGEAELIRFEEEVLSRDSEIAGIIVSSMNIDHTTYQRLREHFPVVFCGQYYGFRGACSVSSNDTEASMELVEHLISTGKKKIAVLAMRADGNVEGHTTNIQHERLQGYQRALEKHGIKYDEEILWYMNVNDSVNNVVDEMLSPGKEIDAVFCMHASIALNLQIAFMIRGLNVPNDIAIAAYDAEDFMGEAFLNVTTVKQHFREFGVESVKMLHSIINGTLTGGKKTYIDHEILVRSSTELRQQPNRNH